MVKKRKTLEEDIDRLAERVWQRGREKITNRTDFNAVYDSYMTGVPHADKMKEKVFSKLQARHKISDSQGRNKARRQVFKQLGVQPPRTKKEGPSYSFLARTKRNKTVWARKTKITVRGKERVVLRSVDGRFVRPLPKE